MTYEEAIEFFAKHGNISSDVERLKLVVATQPQIEAAMVHAAKTQGFELAKEAGLAVLEHYGTLIEPDNQSIVRETTVDQMIDFWERGETYTFPYTRAEVLVAEKRWRAEQRSCPAKPNHCPWESML